MLVVAPLRLSWPTRLIFIFTINSSAKSGSLFSTKAVATAVTSLIVFYSFSVACFADSHASILDKQTLAGLGERSSISVIDLDTKKSIFSYKADQTLAPASTLKLITSVAALHYLGSSFTFKTTAFLLPSDGNTVAIGVKGGADPEFTTEQAFLFARKIKLAGIENIKRVLLDSSALKDSVATQGQRAYEAGSSALSFNFNSIGVQICPEKSKKNSLARVEPLLWEDSIEILNEVRSLNGAEANLSLRFVKPNLIKVSGSIGNESKCVERYLSNQNPITSLGYFIKNLLEEMRLGSNIAVSVGTIPNSAKELFKYESKPLSSLLVGLNHFSTNVSAEQILSAIGIRVGDHSEEFSTTRGIKKLTEFMSKLGFQDTLIEDGSGLSHDNRISTRALTAVLDFAWEDPQIRPFLEASLSILGQSGTLKHRSDPKGDYRVFAKSGTLDGVSSLAGYLYLKSGKSYAFSIIQNEVGDLDRAHKIEERLLQRLAESY